MGSIAPRRARKRGEMNCIETALTVEACVMSFRFECRGLAVVVNHVPGHLPICVLNLITYTRIRGREILLHQKCAVFLELWVIGSV